MATWTSSRREATGRACSGSKALTGASIPSTQPLRSPTASWSPIWTATATTTPPPAPLDRRKRGGLKTKVGGEQGTESLIDNYSFNGEALARAEWTEHRLIYVTPELKKPVHISGTSRVKIKLACDRDAANLSVWLVSLPWNTKKNAKITDNIITRGWADPQNHDSLTNSQPLKPGKFYNLSFDLQPDDQIIAKGQQIGLMIFSSDQDFTLWPEPGTQLTIDLDATSLELPIVEGKRAWRKALRGDKEKKSGDDAKASD